MNIIKRLNNKNAEVAEGSPFDSLVVSISVDDYRVLREDNDFINSSLYAGAVELLDNEVGRLNNCRLICEGPVPEKEACELKTLNDLIVTRAALRGDTQIEFRGQTDKSVQVFMRGRKLVTIPAHVVGLFSSDPGTKWSTSLD